MNAVRKYRDVFRRILGSKSYSASIQWEKKCQHASSFGTYFPGQTLAKPTIDISGMLVKITSAQISFSESTNDLSTISVTWSNGTIHEFLSLHLRDECRCSECFDESSLQRLINLYHDVELKVKPMEVQVSDGNELHIVWEDGHQSSFSRDRLLQLYSSPNKTNIYNNKADAIFWKSDFKIPFFKYDVFMSDDSVLVDFIFNLKSCGISLVKGVPCKEGQIREFSNRFAKLKNTHYMEIFTVKSKLNPNNLAYTSKELKLHVDLPYYAHMPDVQMLHCLKQSQNGGSNIFADGLNCALHLKEADPKAFETLTSYKWPFRDIAWENGKMHYLQNRRSIIEINQYGNIDKISYSNQVRDAIGGSDPKNIFERYRAWYVFSQILHDKQFAVEYLLEEGDLAIFDNSRVLHGRKAFSTDQNSTIRHYEGGYLEWDDIMSSLRVFNKSYHKG